MSTAEAAVPARKGPPAFLSGLARRLSLLFAAIGVISALQDYVAVLHRLSVLMKWVVGAYQTVREQVFAWLASALGWLHIDLPEFPALVKDGLLVLALILAALDFESMSRHRRPLLFSFAREVWLLVFNIFRPTQVLSTRYQGIFAETHNKLLDIVGGHVTLAIGCFIWGWLAVLLGAPRLDMSLGPYALPANAALYGAGVLAVVLVFRYLILDRFDVPAPVASVFRLMLVPAILAWLPLVALTNGWRSVATAMGIVVALVAFNLVFLDVVDPFLEKQPGWLTSLVGSR